MSPEHVARECVVVCGGTREDRAAAIATLVDNAAGASVLVLTRSPTYFRSVLDPGVDVRDDNPAALSDSYSGRLAAPAHVGPAMLLKDRYGAVVRSLSWEYLRRAAESGAWRLVVRELDGAFAALDELAAPAAAAELIEDLWPRNARFAALAAGDGMDPAVRDAHEIAGTLDVLESWLDAAAPPHPGLPPVRIEVAGANPEPAVAAVVALMGIRSPGTAVLRSPKRITPVGGLPAYLLEVAVPAEPDAEPVVIKGELQLRFAGVPVTVPLGGVLARCTVRECRYLVRGAQGPRLEVEFVADPALWPESLLSAHSARTGK